MNAQIHIAPYIRGPEPPQDDIQRNRETIGKGTGTGIRQFSTDLLPHRLIETSESLLAVQVVLLAAVLGTVAAWLLGASTASLVVVLAIDGLLASGLLLGHAARAWINSKRRNRNMNQTKTFRSPELQRAYRATNYPQARAVAMPRATAPTSGGVASFPQLVFEAIEPDLLRPGDVIVIEAGQSVPADGTILEGMAVVDESAITGQSAPVIRHESGVKEVMRGSRVVEGHVFVEVTPPRGHPLDWIGAKPVTLPTADDRYPTGTSGICGGAVGGIGGGSTAGRGGS